MVFWNRQRWRRFLVVAALAAVGYGCQVGASLTTHPDSKTFHDVVIVAMAVFYVAAVIALAIMIRPDE